MTRFAIYAGAATLALVAASAQAQTSWPQQVAQQDGRQLIAALEQCQQYVEQSRRQVCETKARKSGGSGIQLSLGGFAQPGDRSAVRQDR